MVILIWMLISNKKELSGKKNKCQKINLTIKTIGVTMVKVKITENLFNDTCMCVVHNFQWVPNHDDFPDDEWYYLHIHGDFNVGDIVETSLDNLFWKMDKISDIPVKAIDN